jgi:thiol-disulfide isomerase/thioredoxin
MRMFILAMALTWVSDLPASTSTWALEGLPDLKSELRAGALEVVPPPAHHFNTEAPAIARVKGESASLPLKATAQKLAIQLTASPAERDITIEAFVCDDAKTYCKKKKQSFRVAPISVKAAAAKAPSNVIPSPPRTRKEKSAGFEKDTDFIVNDPEKAFALAAKKKLPLMIDFFGIWCPPCNHLDAVVFRSGEFRSKTSKRFVKLKLDSDRDTFNTLKNHYRVQGLPTVVFTTPAGDEIVRVLGFQPLDEMLSKSDMAYRNREEGFAAIAAQATGPNAEARYKAARIALDRDEPARALEWLEPLKELLEATKGATGKHDPRLADYYRAQLGVAQASSDKKLSRRTLEKWLKSFPEDVAAVENYRALAELQSEAGDKSDSKESLEAAIQVAEKLLAAGPASFKGSYYSPAEMAEELADMKDELGDPASAKSAYQACAEAFRKEALEEKSAFARGPSLERAYCLGKAGDFAQAEAIYREGIRRYPDEYTFHQGLAKLWLEAREPAKALREARTAVRNAYGNQKLKALMTVVKAHEALKQPDQAIEAVEAELRNKLPEDASPSTLKLREKLRAKAETLRNSRTANLSPAA